MAQLSPKCLEGGPAGPKRLDRVLARDDGRRVREGVRQPEPEGPPTRRRDGRVRASEQRRTARVVRVHGPADLEMAQGARIEHEAAAVRPSLDELEKGEEPGLGRAHVGPEPTVDLPDRVGGPGLAREALGELRGREGFGGRLESRGRKLAPERRHEPPRGVLDVGGRDKELARLERGDRRRKPVGPLAVGEAVVPLAGRDVDRRVGPETLPRGVDGDKEAVVGPAEQTVLDDRPGRHDAGHLASNEALREPGVLDLVADGDLVPFPDEATQVALDGVVRDPGHRGPVAAGVRGPGGQHHIELAGEQSRVVPERLVEVADPEEHEVARVPGLDAFVLLEERRRRCGLRHRRARERGSRYNPEPGGDETGRTLRGRFELPWRCRHQLSRLAPCRTRLPQRAPEPGACRINPRVARRPRAGGCRRRDVRGGSVIPRFEPG